VSRHYGKLEEVDAVIDAYVNAENDADRERFLKAALAAVADVLVEAAERTRRLREVC
jgi:hypothetical protein